MEWNPDWYQHKDNTKYEPKWEKDIDYSPDRNRSSSDIITGVLKHRVVRIWQVRGLGVMVATADDVTNEQGKLTFSNLAIFTKDEIGYVPNM